MSALGHNRSVARQLRRLKAAVGYPFILFGFAICCYIDRIGCKRVGVRRAIEE